MKRIGCVLILWLLLAPVTLRVEAQSDRKAAPAKRVVIVSWDGAANWIVERLLAEKKLPNVARLIQQGVRADFCTPAFPSKTACGHAAIWTGCYGDRNGISGNSVPLLPRAEHTLLETRSGFDSHSLQAEPLWITAARAGKKVVILSAAQSFPPDPHLATLRAAGVPADRFRSFSGFESFLSDDKVWTGADLKPAANWPSPPKHRGAPRELTVTAGEQTFYLLAYDDPTDPTDGLDTLLIRQNSKDPGQAKASCTLKPARAADTVVPFGGPFRITQGELFGNLYFRLFDLAPDGSRFTLYQRGVNGLRGAATRTEIEQYLDAYGGFHAAPFDAYEAGALGKTLWQGGDGEAEKRLLECIRLDCEFLKRGTRYALARWKPDLLFHYTPMSDSAGHLWMGALDPASPRYDPALAAKLMPFYEQVYQLQDGWLGDILDHAGSDAVVCLVSDHGMEGVGKAFSPNAVLAKAGLLTLANGRIDLTHTRICAPPWGDYLLCVNGTDRKEGIVTAAERESVLQAATQALLDATDPETGKHIVNRVLRPDEVLNLGMGGAAGGDLYIDLLPGYVPTNTFLPGISQTYKDRIGGGVHGFFPLRSKMQAICVLGGAGVRAGGHLSGIRQIDIAPTLARLLGIPTPKDATGHVLGEILR